MFSEAFYIVHQVFLGQINKNNRILKCTNMESERNWEKEPRRWNTDRNYDTSSEPRGKKERERSLKEGKERRKGCSPRKCIEREGEMQT